jgi:hypothetical protein
MCCGQKRAALRTSSATARTQAPSQSATNSTPAQTVPPQSYAKTPVRAVQHSTPIQASRPSSPPPAPVPSISNSNGSVMVRYLERSPVRVQGLQTGRSYEFSASNSVQPVDTRDATALLATRLFRRA